LTLLLVLLTAATPIEVLVTVPQGSEFDRPAARRALDAFPEYFSRAESTIDVCQLYVLYYPPESKGRAVYRIYDALIAAAQRGVRVRVLLDSLTLEGSSTETYRRMRRALAEVPGIEVRVRDLRSRSRYGGCLLHAKYLLIDGRLAVVGSHNWSFAAFTDNHELSLAVDDRRLAGELAAVFGEDWEGKGSGDRRAKASSGTEGLVLVVTEPGGGSPAAGISTRAGLERVFAAAGATLDITVNSISDRVDFGPQPRYRFVDSLIRDADARGVRIRLLVDRWAFEHDSALLAALDTLSNVEVRVADIRSAGPNERTGSVHAKVVVADAQTVLAGSATFSQRQVEECRNVGVLVRDPAAAATLARLFDSLWFSVRTGKLGSH
jgi:phosphatidylserine/phosphatidylglycerophosphate/cardiolipin synthase-like enzyme